MSKARIIKPDFWVSDQIVRLRRDIRLTFIGLWNFCDDNGIHPKSALKLKLELFPGDNDVTEEMVTEWVKELLKEGLIDDYRYDGQEYWIVTGWHKHQYIQHPKYKYRNPHGQIERYTYRKQDCQD
jgi:hypothetical protein